MALVQALVDPELSEPYSIFTYRRAPDTSRVRSACAPSQSAQAPLRRVPPVAQPSAAMSLQHVLASQRIRVDSAITLSMMGRTGFSQCKESSKRPCGLLGDVPCAS
jgi:hypothetical protein